MKAIRNIFKIGSLWVIPILLFSCAQILTPGGGAKDTTPPRIVRYMPDSAAINFNSKNITITFNKYFALTDLQKQLVISPPMRHMPDIIAKGKALSIVIKDTLKSNITYCINFGNSIKDIREGTVKPNFRYVFSTGDRIDTLSLRGTVKNMFDQKPEKDILIMLYNDFSDSIPLKKIPLYYGKTNEDGTYKITNIRSGNYKVFALKDANADFLFNLPDETIGFSDSLIKITNNTKVDLFTFHNEPLKQKLTKVYFSEPGHILFVLAKPLADSLRLHFLTTAPKEKSIYEYSTAKDTINYWYSDALKDSIKIEASEGKHFLELVRLRTPSKITPSATSGRGAKQGLYIIPNVKKDVLFNYARPLTLKFNHPVTAIKANLITLLQRKQKVQAISMRFTDKAQTVYEMQYPLEQDSAYQLFIPSGTITDILGYTNDTVKIDFKTQEERYYGTLKLKTTFKRIDKFKYIVQLIAPSGEIVKEVESPNGIFQYDFLTPGEYKMRLIYDQNGDGRWTTGNYLENREPETILYYPGQITVRSNWDLELEWKIE